MEENLYDVVVIGGGPAGLTAGIYTSRALLKTLVISSAIQPPQAVLTDIIENYPGFPSGINGFDFVENLKEQAEKFGCKIITDHVLKIEKKEKIFVVYLSNGEIDSKSLVVASGRRSKKLGLPKEDLLVGKGISYCAICDAGFYKDKTVAVIGGGDTAFTEAIYLTKFVKKLYLVHRRNQFRATKILQKRLLEKDNVEILTPFVVEKILTKIDENNREIVSGIVIKNVEIQGIKEINCDGVFVCIGYQPNTEFLRDSTSCTVILDTEGYVVTDENFKTSVDGIYACGDCRSGSIKQVICACGEGARAGLSVVDFLEKIIFSL